MIIRARFERMVFSAILVVIAAFAHAGAQGRRVTDTLVIRSRHLGETRPVVVVPPHHDATDSRQAHAVLFLLDSQDHYQFDAAVANVEYLANAGEIPQLIVVGIPIAKDRDHELTPRARGRDATMFPSAGGAPATARFLDDELLPAIRKKYRTLPGVILAGHSLGGLFALHVAATRPSSYVGIIAMSPSLWWNEARAGKAYADSIAKTVSPLRVVVTTGGLERDADLAVNEFATRLQSLKPATLGFIRLRYANDRHEITPLESLIDGLRFIFEPISLNRAPVFSIRRGDSASMSAAFRATQQAYADGARSLGMPGSLPEAFVNSLGYSLLRELQNPRLAAWVFRQNVVGYPQSPNVYDSLGDALLAAGDRRGARDAFQRAIDVALQNGQAVDSATRAKLRTVDRTLRGRSG